MSTMLETAYIDSDLFILPDDGKRYELVDGELKELPPMRMFHGAVANSIGRLFDQHIEDERLPFLAGQGVAFRLGLSGANFRIPDLHVTALQRVPASLDAEPGIWGGFPDIAVEVISPTDTYVEVIGKARLYLERGVAIVLLIDLYHREVTVRQSTGETRVLTTDDILTGEPVLPGFSCSVAEIFSGLDRVTALRAEAN